MPLTTIDKSKTVWRLIRGVNQATVLNLPPSSEIPLLDENIFHQIGWRTGRYTQHLKQTITRTMIAVGIIPCLHWLMIGSWIIYTGELALFGIVLKNLSDTDQIWARSQAIMNCSRNLGTLCTR